MYLNRITADPRDLRRKTWDPYRAHQFVWHFFKADPRRKRDFLFRLDQGQDQLRYYVISPEPCLALDGPWYVDSKPYQPKLQAGDILEFETRVNPVICVKGKRHDVVMHHKTLYREKHGKDARFRPSRELMQQAACEWLTQRQADYGFQVCSQDLRVYGYRQNDFVKTSDLAGQRAARPSLPRPKTISMSTLDLAGILRISDPVKFTEALYTGIGPGKGFGCGMLLVRRPL